VKEPAIADSTSLIGLERIRRLDLLQSLFEPLLISPKVQEEFGVAVEWLKVHMPSNPMFVNVLKFVVDEGEAEAIALALEKSWRLIVDDRKACL
jgi:predicted nucleic acid-binding protein